MLSRYHIEITRRAIGQYFSPTSLGEVVRANIGQDNFPSLLGVDAHRHVCDCTMAQSLAYIADEHARIVAHARADDGEREQRTALGRLLHTVQDIYAHTNYVSLCLSERGFAEASDAGGVAGWDPQILSHPDLRIAEWNLWLEPCYYIPVIGKMLRRVWLPARSHEAINLDSPARGSHFHIAMAMARQHTQMEYARAVAAIREAAGSPAVARFCGVAAYASSTHSPIYNLAKT